jgi:hypothetical protein
MWEENSNGENPHEVVDTVDNHDCWERGSPDSAAYSDADSSGASRDRPLELGYNGVGTEGWLLLTAPDPFGATASIRLLNPLDPALANTTGEFVDALGHAHHQIASQYDYTYTLPRESPDIIATASVPDDPDVLALDSELGILHQASIDVDSMHDTLWSALST